MLLRHGKTNYLLGLAWSELDGGPPKQFLRDFVGSDMPAMYQVLGNRRDGQLVGYTTDIPTADQGKKKQTAKAYSLAAVLVARGEDGIYFLELGAEAWYAVIQGGRLMRHGGEMVMPLREAVAVVKELAQQLDVEVFASSSHFASAMPFSVSDLDKARRKAKPMELLSQGSGATQALAMIAVVAVIASMFYAGWYFLIRTPAPKMSPEQLAEQQRQSYAQSMLAGLPQMDADPTWIVESARLLGRHFPQTVSGFELINVVCTPTQCGATYEISDERTSFSLTGIQERFGPEQVRANQAQRSVLVTMARPPRPAGWGINEVLNPPTSTVDLIDVHGLLRLRAPAVSVDQTFHRESLSNGSQPPGTPGLAMETIRTLGSNAYPAPTFMHMAQVLMPFGFTPDRIELNPPTGGRDSSWQVRWVKVIREE